MSKENDYLKITNVILVCVLTTLIVMLTNLYIKEEENTYFKLCEEYPCLIVVNLGESNE